MKDTQIIELEGERHLMSRLLADGVEVANPVRDHGIDLIAYLDQKDGNGQFLACPIQIKTATGKRFSLDTKYKKFPNLLIVFVWDVLDDNARTFYALTYQEAEKLLQKSPARGTDHTLSKSYTKSNGGYHFEVSKKWMEVFDAYRVKPGKWKDKIRDVAESTALIAIKE